MFDLRYGAVVAVVKFDVAGLSEDLADKVDEVGISWRRLAAELGLSPSTLTRLRNGGKPDVDAFLSLVRWLDQPAEYYTDWRVKSAKVWSLEAARDKIEDLQRRLDRARNEAAQAEQRAATEIAEAREMKRQAEGWRLADEGHLRQLNIARQQLIDNGITPDRRIM